MFGSPPQTSPWRAAATGGETGASLPPTDWPRPGEAREPTCQSTAPDALLQLNFPAPIRQSGDVPDPADRSSPVRAAVAPPGQRAATRQVTDPGIAASNRAQTNQGPMQPVYERSASEGRGVLQAESSGLLAEARKSRVDAISGAPVLGAGTVPMGLTFV